MNGGNCRMNTRYYQRIKHLVSAALGMFLLSGCAATQLEAVSLPELLQKQEKLVGIPEYLYDLPSEAESRVIQGGCVDSSGGMYQCWNTYESDELKTLDFSVISCIAKYNLQTGEELLRGPEFPAYHSNDMTYLPDTNELYLVEYQRDMTKLGVFDADTFAFLRTEEIPLKMDITALEYQPELQKFAVLASGRPVILDRDFQVLKSNFSGYERVDLISQGMFVDQDYIYLLYFDGFDETKQDAIVVYDWDAAYVATVPLQFDEIILEPENLFFVDGTCYITCVHHDGTGGSLFRVDFHPEDE